MDELTLLRDLRDDLDEVSTGPAPAVLLRGRRRLLERAVGSPVVLLRRRRRWSRVVVAAAAAAVLAGGIGVVQVVGLGDGRGATPAAAAALKGAAVKALQTSDPVVGPGQYLKVTTRAVGLAGGPGRGEPGKDPLAGKVPRPLYRLDLETYTVYKPGDTTRDWVYQRSGTTPLSYFSPEDQRLWESVSSIVDAPPRPETIRAKDAHFFHMGDGVNMQVGDLVVGWSTPDPAFLRSLPRDPARLLSAIRRTAGDRGTSRDSAAFVLIADFLRCGYVPADLRAALFDAATQIPGVDVVQGPVNVDGRVGIAVGIAVGRAEPSNHVRQELVFDETTGQVIGEREVLTADAPELGRPAGTVLRYSSVTTEVVSSAP
jgi:hypothetical protein